MNMLFKKSYPGGGDRLEIFRQKIFPGRNHWPLAYTGDMPMTYSNKINNLKGEPDEDKDIH